MKSVVILPLLAVIAGLVSAENPAGLNELAIGDPAPDFRLVGIDGKFMELGDINEAGVLALAFTSNHCPTSATR
jgi:hypothetical protein